MHLNWRTMLAFAHDLIACTIAWLAAFFLRFNFEIPSPYLALAIDALPWVLILHIVTFVGFGLYRGIWRFASLPDLRRIVSAVGICALAVPAVLLALQIPVPRSVFVIAPVFLVVAMGGSRFAYRAWKEHSLSPRTDVGQTPVLIVGAEESAVSLIKELARSPKWRVVGMLGADRSKHGREIHGSKVLGGLDDLDVQARALGVRHAIIAMPEAAHNMRKRAVELARAADLEVLTVPSFDDLMSGKVTVSQIRNIELDDLLGRDPVILDTAGLQNWIGNRVVLITGAGGSIGSELCRQVARYQPRQLVLVELNEFALYNIEQEFSVHFPTLRIVCAIGDIKNAQRMQSLLQRYRPSLVFHAAAYKHVPLMETHNAWQALQNNVLGTYILARTAIDCGVEKFVFVSTDKAVNPTNVMGASKRLAEMVCQTLQPDYGTQFVVVRFGNVLGSTGSVIPKFRDQITKGGPITVTHPEITRYFMSIPEAVQLVLQAGLMGKGGEILILDMGEPVRIADLARELIRLSGYTESEIPIVFTGLRPGEKLYEELLAGDENTLSTPHPKLRVARARRDDTAWLEELIQWLNVNTDMIDDAVKAELARRVPDYTPQHQTHDA